MTANGRKIGLALGAGSARGWAHVGVLRALEGLGIEPDVLCGTSAGALVGGARAAGRLDELESWLAALQWRDVVGYLDLSFTGGLIKGRRLFDFFASHIEDQAIESLEIPFAAVATDLENGEEVWLRHGSLLQAVRASVSVPAFLKPVRIDGRWLVDGGLTNPVPVSLCRALGAEIVIAVDVNDGLLERDRPLDLGLTPGLPADSGPPGEPALFEVVERSLHIAQEGLTRSRLALDPPDVLVTPEVAHVGFLEYHRAAECFDAGRCAVAAVAAELRRKCGSAAPAKAA